MATLIQAAELDVAAAFPQCLDNQFVSFDDFRTIATSRASYKDDKVAASRNARTAMEINRALVYGQQVCVNRASLPNCKSLYELYLPHFIRDGKKVDNPRYQIDEVGQLLQSRAIVPFLFQGTKIEGDGRFNLDDDGQRALAHLLERHADRISFLTLGATDDKIKENAARIALEFETRADRLAGVAENRHLFPRLLADVLPCADLIESVEAAKELRSAIFAIGKIVSERKTRRRESDDDSIGMVSREDVYRAMLIKECSCGKGLGARDCRCVTDGRFSASGGNAGVGATFCLKALVDLVYASNIPDMLQKYLMTPWQLPTRNALQDNGPIERQQAATIDDVARATFDASQRLHADASQAMYLPVMDQLSLADICAIRSFPEWHEFMKAQEQLLENALDSARQFDEFQAKFEALQLAISTFWRKRAFGQRGKKYVSFVSGVFQIGIHALKVGIRVRLKGAEVYAIDKIIDYVKEYAGDRVPVGPAKLLFEVFDAETRELDAARSWSVEWMRKQVSWNKAELLVLLEDERDKGADGVDDSGEPPADVSGG